MFRIKYIGAVVVILLVNGVRAFEDDSLIDLNPYVVTGTKTVHRLSEAPVRTELVSSFDMELAATKSFSEAIELVPGIRVENNCQNCGTSDVLLLGLEGKYTTLLMDGLPMYSGLANVYGFDQIPSIFIDRIEVVKGAASSVYGGGSVGGVVNIISRRPEKTGGVLEMRMDRFKGASSTEISAIYDVVSGTGKSKASVYGLHSKSDWLDLNDDGFSDLTEKELHVVGFKWLQEFEKHDLQFQYNRTVEYRRGGDLFSEPDYLANISERIDTIRDSANLLVIGEISDNLEYHVGVGFASLDRDTFYGGLFGQPAGSLLLKESVPGLGDNDQAFIDRGYRTYGEVARDQFGFTENLIYNFETSMIAFLEQHTLSFGVQYFYEEMEDIVPVSSFVAEYPIKADTSDGNTVGLYFQDDWHFADGWELIWGVRADKNSELSNLIYSPRIGLKWEVSDSLTWRATLGTGFRAPQHFDEDLHIELIAGERAATRQSEDLNEEKSVSGLLSMVWSPAVFEGRFTIESSAFYTSLEDTFTNSEIRIDENTGEAYRIRYNGPDSEVGGIELNLGYLPNENLRFDIGYIWQVARYQEPVEIFADYSGHQVMESHFLESPTHYGVMQSTYLNSSLFDIGLSAIFTGSMKDINERTGVLNESTDSFLVWNLTLSRTVQIGKVGDLLVKLGVKNLTDDRQKDLEAGVDRDPYYLYGPRSPRTYFLSLGLKF